MKSSRVQNLRGGYQSWFSVKAEDEAGGMKTHLRLPPGDTGADLKHWQQKGKQILPFLINLVPS